MQPAPNYISKQDQYEVYMSLKDNIHLLNSIPEIYWSKSNRQISGCLDYYASDYQLHNITCILQIDIKDISEVEDSINQTVMNDEPILPPKDDRFEEFEEGEFVYCDNDDNYSPPGSYPSSTASNEYDVSAVVEKLSHIPNNNARFSRVYIGVRLPGGYQPLYTHVHSAHHFHPNPNACPDDLHSYLSWSSDTLTNDDASSVPRLHSNHSTLPMQGSFRHDSMNTYSDMCFDGYMPVYPTLHSCLKQLCPQIEELDQHRLAFLLNSSRR